MRKIALCVALCLALFSCQKEYRSTDSVSPSQTKASNNWKHGVANCRITRVTTEADDANAVDANEAIFTYTNNGLLQKISYANQLSDDPGNDYVFRYDKNHRLSEYWEGYNSETHDYTWRHVYQYDKHGVIISDS